MRDILDKYVPGYVGANLDGPFDLRLVYLTEVTDGHLTLWDAERSVAIHVPSHAVLKIVEAAQGTKLMTAHNRPTDIVIHIRHNTVIQTVVSPAGPQRQSWVGFGWEID